MDNALKLIAENWIAVLIGAVLVAALTFTIYHFWLWEDIGSREQSGVGTVIEVHHTAAYTTITMIGKNAQPIHHPERNSILVEVEAFGLEHRELFSVSSRKWSDGDSLSISVEQVGQRNRRNGDERIVYRLRRN